VSVAIGEDDGRRYGLVYEIDIDLQWSVSSFSVRSMEGQEIAYRSVSPGRWHDDNNGPLPGFDGCIDIDLSFTPFTNTLPIRRVGLKKGQSREFKMLYVPAGNLTPVVDGQRYTCIVPGRRYLYEATDGGFSAEIELDDFGLVRDYPGLFRRVD
jgi:hypothetical protein